MKKYHSYLGPIFIVAVLFSSIFFMVKYLPATSASALNVAEISATEPVPAPPIEVPAPVVPPPAAPVVKTVANFSQLGSSIPILMYHEIGEGPNALYVSVDNFRAQMHYLRDNGFQVVTMSQAHDLLSQGKIPAKAVVITFDDGYVSVYTKAWPIMQELNLPATVYVISTFPGLYNYLTWDEIKAMNSAGVEIGSHSRTHPALTTVTAAQLTEEIAGSKRELEQHLGVPVSTFCYPTGALNQYTPPVVKAAGYTSAVTIVNRSATAQDDAFLVPRIRVSKNTTISNFAKLFN